MVHAIRCEPLTLTELKTVVDDFAVNISEKDIRKRVRHAKNRAGLRRDQVGGYFEYLLNKRKCLRIKNPSNVFFYKLFAIKYFRIFLI